MKAGASTFVASAGRGRTALLFSAILVSLGAVRRTLGQGRARDQAGPVPVGEV